jgi:hypothetical protein
MARKLRFLARLWFYFRTGYSTYLSFLLGAANTLVVIWYLAIGQIPAVQDLFGHFLPFAVAVTIVGVPLAIGVGWIHIKRSPAYSSEVDITVEAYPYYYKLPPGYTREVWAPVYLELLIQLKRLLEAQRLLTGEERSRIQALEQKLQLLIDGGSVGSPRTKI